MRKSFPSPRIISASAVAVVATTLLLAAGAAAIPTARAASICHAPGTVTGAIIHALSTRNMSCTTARQDTERYIENRTEPHGFTCTVTHHGKREVTLVCHRGDRSFQATWRVTSAGPAIAASSVARAAKTCHAPGIIERVDVYHLGAMDVSCTDATNDTRNYLKHRKKPHGFTCQLSHEAKRVTWLHCRDNNGRWFEAAWRPV